MEKNKIRASFGLKGNVKTLTETRYLVKDHSKPWIKGDFLSKITYDFNLFGNLIRKQIFDINGDLLSTILCSYNKQENLIDRTEYGRKNKIINKEIYTYNEYGKLVEYIKCDEKRIIYNYDNNWNITSAEEYCKESDVDLKTENRDGKEEFVFDTKIEYLYNEEGQLIEKINENGTSTVYFYTKNVINRVENRDKTLGLQLSVDYDLNGNLIEKTVYSFLGNLEYTIIYRYNDYNNLIELSTYYPLSPYKKDYYGNYEYDEKGRLILKEDEFHSIVFSYDENNNKIREFHSGLHIQYEFELKFDTKGNEIEYHCDYGSGAADYSLYKYNKKGNLIEAKHISYDSYEESSSDWFKSLVKFKYDEKGNQIERNIFDGHYKLIDKITTKYLYNEKGELIEKVTCDLKNSKKEKETYNYENRNIKIINYYNSHEEFTKKNVIKYDSFSGKKIIENVYGVGGELISRDNFDYSIKGKLLKEVSYTFSDSNQNDVASYDTQSLWKNLHYKYDSNGKYIGGKRSDSEWSLVDEITYRIYRFNRDQWRERVEFENGTPMHIFTREFEYYEEPLEKGMKFISVKQPTQLLKAGIHKVTITEVKDGKSEVKNTPYFSCRFENEAGYIDSRFYNTEKSNRLIINFIEVAGIKIAPDSTIDTDVLIGKELQIKIVKKTHNSKSHFEAVAFWKIDDKIPDEWLNQKQ